METILFLDHLKNSVIEYHSVRGFHYRSLTVINFNHSKTSPTVFEEGLHLSCAFFQIVARAIAPTTTRAWLRRCS